MKRLFLTAGFMLLAQVPGGTGFAAAVTPPTAQATSVTGTLEGAPYRIDIPVGWNGGLIILLHGYEVKGQPRQDPWPIMPGHGIEAFLERGYAVATSGYSAQGWAVEQAMADAMRLRFHFESSHAKPEHVYAVGFSMGGHLTLALLEQEPQAFDGGLSLCGANMPAPNLFEIALGALAGFDARFPGVLALGREGLADPSSPPMINVAAVEAALAADPRKTALLAEQVGIEAEHLPGTLWLYYVVLREMAERARGFPVDNRETVYSGFGDAAWLNGAVRRYAGDPEALAYVRAHATLSGHIEDPAVSLTNAYDDIVPVRDNRLYGDLAAAAGRSELFAELPPVGSGHCSFTDEQIGTAFDILTRWVEKDQRPCAPRHWLRRRQDCRSPPCSSPLSTNCAPRGFPPR